jgi:hypothetical protein
MKCSLLLLLVFSARILTAQKTEVSSEAGTPQTKISLNTADGKPVQLPSPVMWGLPQCRADVLILRPSKA